MASTGGVRLQITIDSGYALVYGKKQLKALMRKAGGEIAATARALIRRSTGGGQDYRGSGGSSKYRGGYKPGHYTASVPGQAPVSVTGTLANSIKVRPFKSGEGVAIRDAAFYALFLQAGAKGPNGRVLMPRPFLTQALEQREASIGARIKASIVDDIEFRRIKA